MREAIIQYNDDPDFDGGHMLISWKELVRCKDCMYGKIHGNDVECIAHEEVGYDPEPWHPLNWYCADGERK